MPTPIPHSCCAPKDGEQILSVVLTSEDANAIVYTIAFQVVSEAEYLESLPVSSRPLDLLSISLRCARISRFAAINDQLAWWARRSEGKPLTITAGDAILTELAEILEATAQDRIRYPDGDLEPFGFGQAAGTIRAALSRIP